MRAMYLASAISIAALPTNFAQAKATNCRKLVDHYAKAYHVPRNLAHGVIRVESNYNCQARSRTSTARGAGQLIAATARALGVTDPFDCRQNVAASMRYLALAIRRAGSGCAAASLYNLGIGARPTCTAYGRRVLAMGYGR